MSDYERGAYTPPNEAPLAFDPRQPVRGASPAPFTLIISVLVLAALVAAIFLFYRSGVRQAGDAPRTVGEPIGALTAPAPAEAQPTDPAAGLQIYKEENPEPAAAPAPAFVPPPEQPRPRPEPAPSVVVLPPAAPARPPPAASVPVAAKPASPTAKPAPAPKPEPSPAAKPASAPPTAAPAAGGAVVQIGALASSALADKAWSEAVAAAPGLAAGKGKSVTRIEKNGGVLYRTAVTGFASRVQAQAFCARLKAAGKACFVR